MDDSSNLRQKRPTPEIFESLEQIAEMTQITPEIFCTLSCTVYCKTSCFVVLFPFYCLPDGGGAVVGITEVAVSARDDGAENKAIHGHRGQKYF